MMTLPATADAVDAQLPKRLRADVCRQTKRLSAFGTLDLQVASAADEIAERIPNLRQIHTRNCSERTGVAELSPGAASVQFLHALVRHLPVGLIHDSELALAGRPVSAHFGLRWNGRLLWYKPAYDIAWQLDSPGKLHVAFAACWNVKHDFKLLDFLQGNEPYKSDWSTAEQVTQSYTLSLTLGYPVLAWNMQIRRMQA